MIKGLKREKAITRIKEEYTVARKRNAMFDALGVNMDINGTVIYQDGQYVKK